MRLEYTLDNTKIGKKEFVRSFESEVGSLFDMNWELSDSEYRLKMALFISKYDHCLYDILGRYKSGELMVEIPFIVSNHKDLKPIADSFNIPFF